MERQIAAATTAMRMNAPLPLEAFDTAANVAAGSDDSRALSHRNGMISLLRDG